MATKQRPTGVTILAVLALIGGVLSIFAALAAFGASALVGSGAAAAAGVGATQTAQLAGSATYLLILGVVVLIGGVLDIAFGIGAFRGSGWAWMIGVVAQVLGLLVALVNIVFGAINGTLTSSITSNIISIVISVAILYYLNTANVKAYFGRA